MRGGMGYEGSTRIAITALLLAGARAMPAALAWPGHLDVFATVVTPGRSPTRAQRPLRLFA
ncbi:MAG: hypothetical protein U0163_10900 [Gemmatimonadaceae bacterium]